MSTVAATELAPALAASMEAQAINHAEALELYNPDPECNSAVERTIATHREYGIPAERTREDLAHILRALKTNSAGLEILAGLTGDLDRFSRRAHNAGTRSTMTVREVMDATRPALAMLREQDVSDDIVRVVFALARVFASVDEIKPSLAAQLGAGPYQQLLELHAMWTADAGEPA